LNAKKFNLTKISHIHEHTTTEEAVSSLLRYFGTACSAGYWVCVLLSPGIAPAVQA
jgi:hypothetical protein